MKIILALFFVIALFLVGCGNAQKYDRPYYQRPYYPDHHYSPYYYRPYYHHYPPYYYRYHYYRRNCSNYYEQTLRLVPKLCVSKQSLGTSNEKSLPKAA